MYRGVATGAGLLTLVLLGVIGLFLFLKAFPAFQTAGVHFFTETVWRPEGLHPKFGIAAVLYWTVAIATIALVLAVPVAIAMALFINEYAPRWIRRELTAIVDLLAAIPSVIYGLWGAAFLEPQLVGFAGWLTNTVGFIPFFTTNGSNFAGSAFIAGVVVALMVLPICTSVMREVFSQAPPGEKEAALALGATRWGMIRAVILPFGRGGIVGATMLGMGRALGETIAVAIIVTPSYLISGHILQGGSNSVAALIANLFGDASQKQGIPALMAAGLTLFAVTLIVNFGASIIVSRSRSGRGVEI